MFSFLSVDFIFADGVLALSVCVCLCARLREPEQAKNRKEENSRDSRIGCTSWFFFMSN
jgi:hypothetical protein